MEANGHDADGLRRAAAEIAEFAELHPGPARAWYAERGNCTHDLLHVLAGYGQDQAGESALLAFTDGWLSQQRRMRVVRFGMVASLLSSPPRSMLRAIGFSWRARRRGRRARIPRAYRWEDALARPLAEVRAELAIEAPDVAHPGGVLQGAEAPWSLGPAAA